MVPWTQMQIMRSLWRDSGRLSLPFSSYSSSRSKFVTGVHSMAVVNTNVFVSFNDSFIISSNILRFLIITMRPSLSTTNYGVNDKEVCWIVLREKRRKIFKKSNLKHVPVSLKYSIHVGFILFWKTFIQFCNGSKNVMQKQVQTFDIVPCEETFIKICLLDKKSQGSSLWFHWTFYAFFSNCFFMLVAPLDLADKICQLYNILTKLLCKYGQKVFFLRILHF